MTLKFGGVRLNYKTPSLEMEQFRKYKTFDREFWKFVGIFLFLSVVVFWMPYPMTQFSVVSLGTNKPNEIGDSIGGTLGPLVAWLASALTFLAFWIQYKANQEQRFDIKIERFENRFFELVNLHTSIIREFQLSPSSTGHGAFKGLFDEYRFIYRIIEHELNKVSSESAPSKLEVARIAYCFFLYGVEQKMRSTAKSACNVKEETFNKLVNEFSKVQSKFDPNRTTTLVYGPESTILEEMDYKPFNGHFDILERYNRSLSQIVGLVAHQEGDRANRSFFWQVLRSQMSEHEQLLLFYSSLHYEGWWNNELILDSQMILGVPDQLADFGPSIREKFEERARRLNPNVTPEWLLSKFADYMNG